MFIECYHIIAEDPIYKSDLEKKLFEPKESGQSIVRDPLPSELRQPSGLNKPSGLRKPSPLERDR